MLSQGYTYSIIWLLCCAVYHGLNPRLNSKKNRSVYCFCGEISSYPHVSKETCRLFQFVSLVSQFLHSLARMCQLFFQKLNHFGHTWTSNRFFTAEPHHLRLFNSPETKQEIMALLFLFYRKPLVIKWKRLRSSVRENDVIVGTWKFFTTLRLYPPGCLKHWNFNIFFPLDLPVTQCAFHISSLITIFFSFLIRSLNSLTHTRDYVKSTYMYLTKNYATFISHTYFGSCLCVFFSLH